jgi:structural maintenance of chromosome 3 (chondroitin sulfate proteoglycan 6)
MASKWKTWRGKLREHERLLVEVKEKLREIEPQITRILSDLEVSECRRNELTEGKSGTSELELRRKELSALFDLISAKERAKRALEGQISLLNAQIESMRTEIGTTLTSKLTPEEQTELATAIKVAEETRQILSHLSNEIAKMATNVTEWETELDVSLRRRRHDLTLRLGQVSTQALMRELERAEAEHANLDERMNSVESTIAELTDQIKHCAANQMNIQSALDKARTQYDEAMKSHTHRNSSMEKYLAKRMALLERRETLQRRIRELAVAPDAEYDALKEAPGAELLCRLHTVNEELRTRYAHVNKKAHEQHASFHRQGDALRERQKELVASARAIEEFVVVLDRRKDEAIERTFQQVARGFGEVFERLVPSGRGELLMLRQGLDDGVSSGSTMMEVDRAVSLEFSGVAIRVSFNGKADEGLLMSQLSGGQKSLVALALIFAIQRCDPAPFYLFDEIDANLDAAYRTSVANLVGEMKADAQFLTTTFRPELLEGAESFFGVSFGGRVSRVESITREQALQFVELDPLGAHV